MLDLSSLEKACEALALSLKLYDKSSLPVSPEFRALLEEKHEILQPTGIVK